MSRYKVVVRFETQIVTSSGQVHAGLSYTVRQDFDPIIVKTNKHL